MTGTINVEEVLSKLNNVEKVTLLAGTNPLPFPNIPKHFTDNKQEPTGGIPRPSPNMASPQSASPMAPTASEALNSSTASQRLVSHAEPLSAQHGTLLCSTKLGLLWEKRVKPRVHM